jgi:hypothetical protein
VPALDNELTPFAPAGRVRALIAAATAGKALVDDGR